MVPRPRGSKPKSPGRLPSSHGGGVLPGNQRGLSGSGAKQQEVTDLALDGDANLLTLSFLPPKKEALVAPAMDALLWELQCKVLQLLQLVITPYHIKKFLIL